MKKTMKWIVPAIVICAVGGILDTITDLHKIWCFLIGVLAFYVCLFLRSALITLELFIQKRFADGLEQNFITNNVMYPKNKIVQNSLLSIVFYSLYWVIWLLVEYFIGLPCISHATWIGIVMLTFIALAFSAFMDKTQILIDMFLCAKILPHITPLFFAWIPTLTLGLLAVIIPIRFGYVGHDMYGQQTIGIKECFVIGIFVLFPFLNIISMLRTPWMIKQNMLKK